MQPTQELINALYRDRVWHARRMSPEDKLFAGGELFDSVCERMRWGIRMQFPDADEGMLEGILIRRLNRLRWLDERAIYRPVENPDEQ